MPHCATDTLPARLPACLPACLQALARCIVIYPSLHHLALIADMALAAATPVPWAPVKPTGLLSAAVLLGAVQRLLSQAKAVVGAACMVAFLCCLPACQAGQPPNRSGMQLALGPRMGLAPLAFAAAKTPPAHPTHPPHPQPCFCCLLCALQVGTIAGLSILDLILLVAIHRLTAKGVEDLNFEMVSRRRRCCCRRYCCYGWWVAHVRRLKRLHCGCRCVACAFGQCLLLQATKLAGLKLLVAQLHWL